MLCLGKTKTLPLLISGALVIVNRKCQFGFNKNNGAALKFQAV